MPRLGTFTSHNGAKGVVYKDERGGYWMRFEFEGATKELPYNEVYVKKWKKGRNKGGDQSVKGNR